ncbi:hypothetical protein EYR40_008741 [Pleurotus pulmonarius]|nr:hypothetical protein EYR36_009563 [Pleurotus pulmonarius]KAF4593943.1 hypothetical protein EYR40_008741 [Pleurotus pulmonarius]
MKLLSLSFMACVAATFAKVVVNIPVSDQLPKIARVDKPYSWTISPNTFTSSNGELEIIAKSLPGWLSFDPVTRTFSGTPGADDEGTPGMVLLAKDASSSILDHFTLCVTPYPSPTLHTAISEQFANVEANTALSSVYGLSPKSALATSNPTIRIPPSWSFSIGFLETTYIAENDLFSYVLGVDGSPLPSWMWYNPNTMTLNGVTPKETNLPTPYTLRLSFFASDQEGYSALSSPFDIVVARHEFSQSASSLPTMNFTADTPFSINLQSPSDFMGLLIDNKPMHPGNISTLTLDTSSCPWLTYNEDNRSLSGTPPSQAHDCKLSASVATTFNQTIQTEVSIAAVPSFFKASALPPVQLQEDGCIHFNLAEFYAKDPDAHGEDADVSMTCDPSALSNQFTFDKASGEVSGCISRSVVQETMSCSFTAFSSLTHSTSHATLPIAPPPSLHHKGSDNLPSQLSAVARKRLHLGLGITFGLIGGMCLIAAGLAAVRHCATVRDSALDLEANKKAWSEKDKKWYGIDSMKRKPSDNTSGYGSTEALPRNGLDLQDIFRPPAAVVRDTPGYGDLSHGPGLKPPSVAGSNVMSKREFLTKIKDTVRQVSDQYQRILQGGPARPVIGKPILATPESRTSPDPIDESLSYTPSGIDSSLNSPSSSIADRSVPRRRADFAPPRSPDSDALLDPGGSRPGSYGSSGSLASAETHAAEAVVHTATRATSIHSVALDTPQLPPATRPRIVPFTSSTRVPVPRIPTGSGKEGGKSRRIPSQKAQIVHDTEKSGSGDDLSLGIHYVRALGADQRTVGTNASMPTVSTNARSSFSSLESSHYDHSGPSMQRMLVRAEQKFHFRVPVFLEDSPTTYLQPRSLTARLASGLPLPKFLRADLRGKQQGSIEFYGTPGPDDIADYDVEIYSGEDKCVARVAVEVVARG